MTFQYKVFEGCQTYKLCRWVNLMKIRKRISDRTWNKNRQSSEIARGPGGKQYSSSQTSNNSTKSKRKREEKKKQIRIIKWKNDPSIYKMLQQHNI